MYSKLKEATGEDYSYRDEVDVDFYFDDFDISADSVKVNIPFSIEVEYRDWGIKDIQIILNGLLNIAYYIVKGESDDEEEQSVSVELDKLNIEWVSGSSYGISNLDLYINKDGQVNYERTTLYVFYLNKERI